MLHLSRRLIKLCIRDISLPLQEETFEYLGDGGMAQNGLNVLGAEVSATGHQRRGNNQHSKSLTPGPVDYVMNSW